MNYESIGIYSQLFNPQLRKELNSSEGQYFKKLYQSPVHTEALKSILANSSTDVVESNLNYLNEFYSFGVEYMSSLTGFDGIVQGDGDVDTESDIEIDFEPKVEPHLQTEDLITLRNVCVILTVFFQTLVKKDFGKEDIRTRLLTGEDLDAFTKMLQIIKLILGVKQDDMVFVNIEIINLIYEVLTSCSRLTSMNEKMSKVNYLSELLHLLDASELSNSEIGKIMININILTIINPSYQNFINDFEFKSDTDLIVSNLNKFLIKNMCANLKFYYNLNNEELVTKVKNESFLNWLTLNRFNTNLNLSYELNDLLDFFIDDELQLLLKFKRIKYQETNNENKFANHAIPMIDLLPISMFLYNLIIYNERFGLRFTKQETQLVNLDEVNPEDDETIETLEIYLCNLSYIFQYQHNFRINQLITRLNLLILFKLVKTPSYLGNLKEFKINEYKFKICHHFKPVIPNDSDAGEHKVCLYYILDILQCYIRFNLTKKLNLINIKLCSTIILNILEEIISDGISITYQWDEFFKSLVSLVLFIYRQNLILIKNEDKLSSIIEEILIIFNLVLLKFDRTIKSDLLYKILSSLSEFNDIFTMFKLSGDNENYSLSYLVECLRCLNENFENSQADFHSDSPELDEKLVAILDDETMKHTGGENKYKYDETFVYDLKNESLFRNLKITLLDENLDVMIKNSQFFRNK